MKNVIRTLGLVSVLFLPFFTACREKEDPEQQKSYGVSYDDLAVFQEAIYLIDDLGQFVHYNVGEVLYDSDPHHLYIGVDDIEQAAKMFRNWIASDVDLGTIDANVKDLTANLTDANGKAQGSVSFKAGSGSSVAEVTFSSEITLEYVDKITFLHNSAWPYNSGEIIWHKGDIRKFHNFSIHLQDWDQVINFVLVREAANGIKPMWVGLTSCEYETHTLRDFLIGDIYVPGEGLAKEISNILKEDWDFFVDRFDEAGYGKLEKDKSYWYDHSHYSGFLNMVAYRDLIVLSNGFTWGTSSWFHLAPIILKRDFREDTELLFTATAGSSGYETYEDYYNVCDGSEATKWCTTQKTENCIDGSGKCWFVEFESEGVITPTGYSMTTARDIGKYSTRNPKKWKLYGKKRSRDNWTLIDSRDNAGKPSEQLSTSPYKATEFSPLNGTSGQYQFFRLEVTETWGANVFQIAEFTLKL